MFTQPISTGFCLYGHNVDPLATLDELQTTQDSLWQRPVLQLLDVQRFVMDPDPTAPTRYYLALSDGKHCIWAVVPPGHTLETVIDNDELDVGCLVTLLDYVVVSAKCGKSILVILQADYSNTPFSLMGDPLVDPTWVPLSTRSLMHQRDELHAAVAAARHSHGKGGGAGPRYTNRLLAEFLPENDVVMLDPMERWAVTGRVLWKSRLRKTNPQMQRNQPYGNNNARSSRGGDDGSAASSEEGPRLVFDCVLVDASGDAMKLVFWGCRRYYDMVVEGSVIRVADGAVKRDEPRHHQPLWLNFHDRSVVEQVTSSDDLPHRPSRLIGVCSAPFSSVSDVMQHKSVGEVVTVYGIITSAQPKTQIRTVRGVVDKMSITLRDARSSQFTVEVTLWDDAARDCRAATGQIWGLRDVVVRYFGAIKQLSTRASSELFELPQAFLESGDPLSLFTVAPQAPAAAAQPDALAGNETMRHNESSDLHTGFYFDFKDCASDESAFILVRVQHVKLPLFYVACQSCGGQMKGLACLTCNSTATELRFLLRMDVSDGVDVMHVVGFTTVAEALFGETTAAFLDHASKDPHYGSDVLAEMMGLPVLIRVVKTGSGIRHVSELKHVDLSKASAATFAAIELYD